MTRLIMIESDVIRSVKSKQYSPIDLLVSRVFQYNLDDIDVKRCGILIWDIYGSYISYKYSTQQDISLVCNFMDDWEAFLSGSTDFFTANIIEFDITQEVRISTS